MVKIPDLTAIRDWCKSKFQPIGNYAAASDIPTQTSDLTNNSGYITNEADNLANYYKKSDTYNRSDADEKFAEKTEIPTSTSDLTNDSNFLTDTGDASNTTVTFEQAADRVGVQPGDDLATAFSKLSKYCADLKPVAFSNSYTDLDNKPSIPTLTNNLLATEPGTALDAAVGPIIKGSLDAVTKYQYLENPTQGDVLEKLKEIFPSDALSNSVPFAIYTNDGGLGVPNGLYLGVLTSRYRVCSGILVNNENVVQRLNISARWFSGDSIYIKPFTDVSDLKSKIDQINSDLGGFKYITVYKNTPNDIVNNLEQFKGKTPFLFICYNLTDRTLYPYIPVPYSSGIYNVLGDGIYRTILLFDEANLYNSTNNIYFARLKGDDEVKWYTVPTSEL